MKQMIDKTRGWMEGLAFCLLVCILAACGDDVYYTVEEENTDERLCGRTWVEKVTVDDGSAYVSAEHQLVFSLEGQSRETWVWRKAGGGEDTSASTFTWRWMDESREGIVLDFGAGELKYFENVWVRDHYLSGKLDGKVVMMKDGSYRY